MSSSKPSFQNYDREEAEEYSGFLLTNAATAKDFITRTTDPDAIRYLVEDYTIDVDVPGAGTELYRGVGIVVLAGILVSMVITLTFLPSLLVNLLRLRGARNA